MTSNKLLILLFFSALFIITSCEKDESIATPSSSGTELVGTYAFQSEENLEVNKWIENGQEVTPDTSDINYMLSFSDFYKNDVNFEFASNFKITLHDLASSEKHTTDYKIKNNVIFISLVDNPTNDDDYVPLLTISNDKLYAYNHGFEYNHSNGSVSISTLQFSLSYNVLDSGLKQNNMQSVSQLIAGEQILTSLTKIYFSKK